MNHAPFKTRSPSVTRARRCRSVISLLAVILVLLSIDAHKAAAGELKDSDRDRVVVMLAETKTLIEDNYWNPGIKGPKLDAQAELARTRIEKADSIGEAFAALAQFVLDLNDSHTFFVPPETRIHADYGWQEAAVGNHVYVVKVNPKSDAARQGITPGDEVLAINGLMVNRKSLRNVAYIFNMLRPQPGLHLELRTPEGAVRELDVAAQVSHTGAVVDTRRELEQLEDHWQEMKPILTDDGPDVLIAKVPSFAMHDYDVDEIFHRAHGKSSLIVDLRGDTGGPVGIVEKLIGGLFGPDTKIGTAQTRTTRDELVAKGTGSHAFTGRVFVLVDASSASCSELFARIMQLDDRGTVVGDTSMGAVMGARSWVRQVYGRPSYYAVEITVSDLTMSDGQRLENVGVTPDFVVLPSAEDLRAGRDPALAKALAFAHTPLYEATAPALTVK